MLDRNHIEDCQKNKESPISISIHSCLEGLPQLPIDVDMENDTGLIQLNVSTIQEAQGLYLSHICKRDIEDLERPLEEESLHAKKWTIEEDDIHTKQILNE